jgi:hypothetical protein
VDRFFSKKLIVLFAVIMSFMLDGRNVSVVRDDSSSHSLVVMSFVSVNRSRDGVFRALVTWLKGDVRLSTEFLFTVRDTLPATVVLGRDWFAFCRDILHSHPEVRLPLCQWTLAEDFALPSVSTTGRSFTPVADTCITHGSPWWDNFRCLGPNPRPSAVSLCFLVPGHSRTS